MSPKTILPEYPLTERDFLEGVVQKLLKQKCVVATEGYAGGGYIRFMANHQCSFAGLGSDLEYLLKRSAP